MGPWRKSDVERADTVDASDASEAGWIKMFDGEGLEGWSALMHPDVWSVKDGMIVGSDATVNSLLFYKRNEAQGGPEARPSRYRFKDFEFKTDIKLASRGVSSMYFRAEFGPSGHDDVGVAPGYIAQANNTATEIRPRTGSLYSFVPIYEQLVPDDTWWTQHVIAVGNRIRILVNGDEVVNYVDRENTYREGYLALLVLGEWAPTTVCFRNPMMRDLGGESALTPGPR